MSAVSPLRYPGGKAAMAGLLGQISQLNLLGGRTLAEPYAGGAGASLELLYKEATPNIYLNDADPAIFALWWSLANKNREFVERVLTTPVTLREWKRQRKLYRSKARTSRFDRGFAAFFLNRCNRSGIILNGGPIGGINQLGRWKLDARFNRRELGKRCQRVAEYGQRILVAQRDGIDFIGTLDPDQTLFFIDPPYYAKGQTLYLNRLDHSYHARLAEILRGLSDKAWVLTYDDCPEVRRLYEDWARIQPFALRYSASKRRMGREIMIVPRWMRLPRTQRSAALSW